MMARIDRPTTAFSLSSGQRRPREESSAHLKFIRSLPSVVSGSHPVQACHLRFGSLEHGKPKSGVAEKPDDCWTLPLIPAEHHAQHARGDEMAWWASQGILNPLDIALRLWAATGDDERGNAIIRAAIQQRLDRGVIRSAQQRQD